MRALRSASYVILFLLALAAVSACTCGRGSWRSHGVTELVPQNVDWAVVVPNLALISQKVSVAQELEVASFAAQLAGFNGAKEALDSISQNTGVDIRSAAALTNAGLAPEQGVVVVKSHESGAVFVVLGVSKESALVETVAGLARNRLGATERSEHSEGGIRVLSFKRPHDWLTQLALGFQGRYAVLATWGEEKDVRAFIAQGAKASLYASPKLQAALARLPRDADFYAHVPHNPTWVGGGEMSLTLNGSLQTTGLVLTADGTATPDSALTQALAPGKNAPELLPLLPKDAVVRASWGGDPAALSALWKTYVFEHVREPLGRAGVDVEKDWLPNLKPGAVISLSLAPTASLAGGAPELDVRRTNPFRFVQLAGAGEVRDAAKAKAALQSFASAAPKLGMKVTSGQRAGHDAFLTTYSQGEGVSFAQSKERVFLGAPVARLDELLAEPSNGDEKRISAEVRHAMEGQGLAVTVDLAQLAASIKALPSEAWGTGGFAMKATALRWLEGMKDLTLLSLTAKSVLGAVQVQLRAEVHSK